MGYPIPTNSPQVTVGTRTFAVACYTWSLPIGGQFNKVAIYELQPGGAWNETTRIGEYENPGDMFADMQAKGGSVKYLAWLVAQINAFFVTMFGSAPTPVPVPVLPEPTTDAEAMVYINAHFAAMKITVVNGVPVMA